VLRHVYTKAHPTGISGIGGGERWNEYIFWKLIQLHIEWAYFQKCWLMKSKVMSKKQ